MTREQYFPIAINMVDLIAEYCETYKEWPKQNVKDNKTKNGISSAKLARWLYTSEYMNGSFKYSSVSDNNGVNLKYRLDQLYNEYGRLSLKSDEFKIKIVESLVEYCDKYKEWPKYYNKKEKTEKEMQSHRLASWLVDSNYYDNFKYKHIINKDGISIKDKIDYYYNKYGVINKQTEQHKIQMVDLIAEYCETYKEWPRFNNHENKTNNGTTSHQLATWLTRNDYLCSKFKYEYIIDENGISLKERLDKLFEKYGYINRQSNASKILMVDLIEEYCDTYKEWPKESSKLRFTKSGITNKQLGAWLKQSGYYANEFKYADVIDESGIKIKDRLDKLYQQYVYISNKSDKHKVLMVELIEEYCNKYKKWPTYVDTQNTVQNVNSLQLIRWLNTSGYIMGEFKYANIVDNNGVCLQDRLDKLFKQYGPKKEPTVSKTIEMVNLIEEYCKLYEKWPKRDNSGIDNEIGMEVQQLVKWLNVTGYYTKNFKYKAAVDEKGINIQEKLNKLFAIYANEYEVRMLGDKNYMDLNLCKAKDSGILGLELYYLAVKLVTSYKNFDSKSFLRYRVIFESKLKENNITFNAEQFFKSFFMPLCGRLDFYYEKWQQYYNENNYDLAILFRNLYNYENNLSTQKEEKQKIKK